MQKVKSIAQKCGWFQSVYEDAELDKMVVKEVKNFTLPKGLTIISVLDLNQPRYVDGHIIHLFESLRKRYSIVDFGYETRYNEKGQELVKINFITTTYSKSRVIKNEIDKLWSALLATHRINVCNQKLKGYYAI